MPKADWGIKRECPDTGKRFYDLNRDPIVSPYTGKIVAVEPGNTSALDTDVDGDDPAADDAEEALLDDAEEGDFDVSVSRIRKQSLEGDDIADTDAVETGGITEIVDDDPHEDEVIADDGELERTSPPESTA